MHKYLRINKRVVLLITSLILVIFFLVKIVNLYYGKSSSDETYIPGMTTITYSDLNVWKYYVSIFANKFIGYPWVVRVSYGFIIFSIIYLVIVILSVSFTLYPRMRENIIFHKYLKEYHSVLVSILTNSKSLTLDEERKIMHFDVATRPKTRIEYMAWFRVLRTAYTSCGKRLNMHNLKLAMDDMGLMDFIYDQLLHGSRKYQVFVIESILQMQLNIKSGIMVRFLNASNSRLRKIARLYYMFGNKEEPFNVLDDKFLNSNLSRQNLMEIHRVFEVSYKTGKILPPFKTFIDRSEIKSIKGFFIREAGYWGNDDDMDYILTFFDSDEPEFHIATCRAVAIHKYRKGESLMISHFDKEPLNVRLVILDAIMSIKSGEAADFLINEFQKSILRMQMRKMLYCLWNYSEKTRNYFYEMKSKSDSDLQVMFNYQEKVININPRKIKYI